MSPQKQGYLYVLITMCIWGGFTLTARLSANWGISAWDLTALRFLLAFIIDFLYYEIFSKSYLF